MKKAVNHPLSSIPQTGLLALPALVAGLMNLSVPFGLLLWLSATVQLLCSIEAGDSTNGTVVRCRTRSLSRQIYLVLYLLAAGKQLRYLTGMEPSVQSLAQSMQGLQPYFGYALISLLTIHAAAQLRSVA